MKKKAKTPAARGRGRPKSPAGPPVTISANVQPSVRDALDDARAERRWSRSQMLAFILEEWLLDNGFWARVEYK
jgi:hypothetical protein